jgi:hypothetical protein
LFKTFGSVSTDYVAGVVVVGHEDGVGCPALTREVKELLGHKGTVVIRVGIKGT